MRHQLKKHKLDSKHSISKLIVRNLATSLVMYDKVTTTKALAKNVKSTLDRLISSAKKTDKMNAIRKLNAYFLDEKASKKVMEVLIEKYKDRPSGFTRVKQDGVRSGDGAMKYVIEFI